MAPHMHGKADGSMVPAGHRQRRREASLTRPPLPDAAASPVATLRPSRQKRFPRYPGFPAPTTGHQQVLAIGLGHHKHAPIAESASSQTRALRHHRRVDNRFHPQPSPEAREPENGGVKIRLN